MINIKKIYTRVLEEVKVLKTEKAWEKCTVKIKELRLRVGKIKNKYVDTKGFISALEHK